MRPKTDVELSGELEAVATAAAERLRAVIGGDVERDADLRRKVGEAASRAIAAGLSLVSIADAEQIGWGDRARNWARELLRRVERAARREREIEREYEQAVVRAGLLGLAHWDVAAAAQVAHGTVRAIIARTQTDSVQHASSTAIAVGTQPRRQAADASRVVDVAAEQA